VNPSIVTPFLLTMAVSFLIGIGLREYYEGEKKFDTFGTVRTFVFIGMLGFVLYQLPEIGHMAFLMGLVALCLFLLVYYANKVMRKKSPGLIGVLIGLLTYATGPIALSSPNWYLVLLAISILFILHSKGRIRQFTDRLETGEVVTACKFLAIAAVILPLIPATPKPAGWLGQVVAALPVTPQQIWLAVVITTAISYLGYVLQTYLFPRRGLILAGLVGGVYSSTVTVLVLAKKSKSAPELTHQASRGILLAVSMMYMRLLILVAIFRFSSAIAVAPVLIALSCLASAYAFGLRWWSPVAVEAGPDGSGEVVADPDLHKNPLELNSAFFFAVLFVVVSFATKYVLVTFQAMGLRMLSFVVGFSDITPFVVSLLQGSYGIDERQILQAIMIASASNNLLKTAYTYIFGSRRTANLAAPGMIGLAILAALYATFVI
jgi:uncharacterized membrane protein (DUF4010 family)